MSPTLNSDPDRVSVTVNNSPCEPCTINKGDADPDPITVNLCTPELDINAADAVIFPVAFIDPVNVEFVFTTNPAVGDTDAVALPDVIWLVAPPPPPPFIAYDAVKAYDADVLFTEYEAEVEFNEYDADVLLKAYDALVAFKI